MQEDADYLKLKMNLVNLQISKMYGNIKLKKMLRSCTKND